MKMVNIILGIFIVMVFLSCPEIWPLEKSAFIYCYVMDKTDSSYIENANVYYLRNLTDISDSLPLSAFFNYDQSLKRYWGPRDREIPAGYIYTKALGYRPDTTQIGKTENGETQTVYIYLKEN